MCHRLTFSCLDLRMSSSMSSCLDLGLWVPSSSCWSPDIFFLRRPPPPPKWEAVSSAGCGIEVCIRKTETYQSKLWTGEDGDQHCYIYTSFPFFCYWQTHTQSLKNKTEMRTSGEIIHLQNNEQVMINLLVVISHI